MTGRSARLNLAKGLAFLALASALGSAACGGVDAPAAKSPAGESPRTKDEDVAEPRTIEEAEEQIARSRAQLEMPGDGAPSAESSKADSRQTTIESPRASAPPSPPQSGAAAPTQPPSPRPQAGGAGPVRREERAENRCADSCRALASMERAVSALCRMTGDSDDRCVNARRTLGESTHRISTCRCDAR